MTRQAKTAIAASVAIHAIAFMILTAVKLYYGKVGVKLGVGLRDSAIHMLSSRLTGLHEQIGFC
jgi:small basic protein